MRWEERGRGEEEAAIKHSRRRWLVYEQKEGGGVRDHGDEEEEREEEEKGGTQNWISDRGPEGGRISFLFPLPSSSFQMNITSPGGKEGSERGCGMGEEVLTSRVAAGREI